MSIIQLNISSIKSNASNSQDFTVRYTDALQTPDNSLWNTYEIGLYKCNFINSIRNISTALNNNVLVYNNGVTNKTITIPDGNYDVVEINAYIQRILRDNNDYSGDIAPFTLQPNTSTLRCEFHFNLANFTVDLNTGELYKLLGFYSTKTYTYTGSNASIFEGSQRANINRDILGCQVNISIIDGAVNEFGVYSNTIFSGELFAVSGANNLVEPSAIILYQPINVSSNRLNNIRVWLTDQNGVALPLDPTEAVSYVFLIKKIETN